MESNVAQLNVGDRLWAWFELHRKQTLWSVLIAVLVGGVAGFYLWRQSDRQAQASYALSRVTSSAFGQPESAAPEELLKVAAEYPNTQAAGRALMLAGARLFEQGKYEEGKAQFERFLRDYRSSPFAHQALYGVATCLEAMGRTSEAITAYNNISQHYGSENVAPQARLALARLYIKENKPQQARDLLLELVRGNLASISSEAYVYLENLLSAHPELAPSRQASTNAPTLGLPVQ